MLSPAFRRGSSGFASERKVRPVLGWQSCAPTPCVFAHLRAACCAARRRCSQRCCAAWPRPSQRARAALASLYCVGVGLCLHFMSMILRGEKDLKMLHGPPPVACDGSIYSSKYSTVRFRVWNTSSLVILTADYINTAVFCTQVSNLTADYINAAVFCIKRGGGPLAEPAACRPRGTRRPCKPRARADGAAAARRRPPFAGGRGAGAVGVRPQHVHVRWRRPE
eukprot:COSAG06_NODE_2887_length_6130_cov_5.068611_6_plen_223_part_00